MQSKSTGTEEKVVIIQPRAAVDETLGRDGSESGSHRL